MRLYSGMLDKFIEDTVNNQISDKLKKAFYEQLGYNPTRGEISSWQNSLRAIASTLQYYNFRDQGIILEYQMPNNSRRLDFLICGKDKEKREKAVIIELKQWEETRPSDGENEVKTYIGQGEREKLHPSVQVSQYMQYLLDYSPVFYDGKNPVGLDACAYLHNYNRTDDDPIFSTKFQSILSRIPAFTKDETKKLVKFMESRVSEGEGLEILKKIEKSPSKPSKKLMNHVAEIIRGEPQYTLLDEQLIVYDKIFSAVKNSVKSKKKKVIIVEGGPGTGKSVIAINVMAKLSAEGYAVNYATGSKAFTKTLRNILGKRIEPLLKFFNSYESAKTNEVDVVLADEAHRLWHLNRSRFTPKSKQSNTPIIDNIIRASRTSVFFIDNLQVIRPNEVGTVEYVEENAKRNDCDIEKYRLEAQFRCKGSDAFINWINNTLGIERTANPMWTGEESLDFRICQSPEDVENLIKRKIESGKTGRMTAGFCWEWSDPNEDGTLKNDVQIGDYVRPWNAKKASKNKLNIIPESDLWAHTPEGINQIGCVYTIQGFEFDYVGVIFGQDLRYNLDSQKWEGHPENSHDKSIRKRENFEEYAKNIYRILLSRGVEGCYVYFQDKDTERFFKTRMENRGSYS